MRVGSFDFGRRRLRDSRLSSRKRRLNLRCQINHQCLRLNVKNSIDASILEVPRRQTHGS